MTSSPDDPVVPEDRRREGADEPAELYRLLVASVRDYAIFALDPQGHVLTWNVGAAQLKGYRAEEIIGRHFSVFYQAEDIAAKKPEIELRSAGRDGRFEDEGWRLRKDGSRFWANVIVTALRNEQGDVIGFAKVTKDLTERRSRRRGGSPPSQRPARLPSRARASSTSSTRRCRSRRSSSKRRPRKRSRSPRISS
jgi:PAS domain S-box-containing protein